MDSSFYNKLIEEKESFNSIFQLLETNYQLNKELLTSEKMEYYHFKINFIRKIISDFNKELTNDFSPSIEECNIISNYNNKIDQIIQPFLLPILLYSTYFSSNLI
jgi:hypothetical protein